MKTRNELARDAYSYLHFPMVASVVLVALGMKSTLAHVGDPLDWELATALAGGSALYLLAQVAFKWRALHALSVQRLVTAIVLIALVPVAHEVAAVITVGLVGAVMWALIAFEGVRYREARDEIRHAPVE